jgi:hypothetical protein
MSAEFCVGCPNSGNYIGPLNDESGVRTAQVCKQFDTVRYIRSDVKDETATMPSAEFTLTDQTGVGVATVVMGAAVDYEGSTFASENTTLDADVADLITKRVGQCEKGTSPNTPGICPAFNKDVVEKSYELLKPKFEIYTASEEGVKDGPADTDAVEDNAAKE